MTVYWLEQTAHDVPASNDWLHPNEAARLAAMRFPKRRDDWRLGRWTAKHALAAYQSAAPALHQIEIRAAASGAPEVFLNDQAAPFVISISHRDNRAICAIAPAGTALGCDLEIVEPRTQTFAADYFTPEEQALVEQAAPTARPAMLALIWSAKESALKALREGLRLDTRSVIVTLPPADASEWHPLVVRSVDGRIFPGWWQQTENIVRTLVSDPPVNVPIRGAGTPACWTGTLAGPGERNSPLALRVERTEISPSPA